MGAIFCAVCFTALHAQLVKWCSIKCDTFFGWLFERLCKILQDYLFKPLEGSVSWVRLSSRFTPIVLSAIGLINYFDFTYFFQKQVVLILSSFQCDIWMMSVHTVWVKIVNKCSGIILHDLITVVMLFCEHISCALCCANMICISWTYHRSVQCILAWVML